jgi:outer membrane protein assembly factor BamB
VLLTAVYSEQTGYKYHAFDLESENFDQLWTLDPANEDLFSIVEWTELKACNGVFYIGGNTVDNLVAIAAVRASDKTVLWQVQEPQFPNQGAFNGCAVGIIGSGETAMEVLFASFTDSSQSGVLALNAADGSPLWWDTTVDQGLYFLAPTLDAFRGLVYTNDAAGGYRVLAYDAAAKGEVTPVYEAQIDGLLNGPPTLGIAEDSEGVFYDALFVVTNPFTPNATVYAFKRDDLSELWQVSLPVAAWTSAVYAGGRLYVVGNDREMYVLSASDGTVLSTIGRLSYQNSNGSDLVVADVRNAEGIYHSTLYHFESNAQVGWQVAALTYREPPPPEIELRLTAEPAAISTDGQASTITATLVSPDNGSVFGHDVTFSSNASNNQGTLSSSTATTDLAGVASVEFVSQKRDGTVRIEAHIEALGLTESVDVSISKSGDLPTDAGSISGIVYASDGKVARKARVDLFVRDATVPLATTNANAKGKYAFENLPLGSYTVEVLDGDLVGWLDVELTDSTPNVSDADIHCLAPQP